MLIFTFRSSLLVLLLLSGSSHASYSDVSFPPKAATAEMKIRRATGILDNSKYGSNAACLPPVRGGGETTDSKIEKASIPLLLNPRFLFTFMTVGTASFAIPALLAPEFMHPVLVASGTDYPTGNTFYVYMFAIRECYLAATFGMAAFMPASTLKAWQLWSIIVLASHSIMNIFHSGWNSMLQPFIIGIHAIMLLLNILSYKFAAIVED